MSVVARLFLGHYHPQPLLGLARATVRPCRLPPTRFALHTTPSRPPSALIRRPAIVRHSTIDPAFLLAAVALSAGAAYVLKDLVVSPIGDKSNDSTTALPQHDQSFIDTMASPKLAPGRPGNLTPEQEQKLKEMWLAVLEVFGVATQSANGTTTPSPTRDGEDKKKKKSRLSLFGRKKDDSDDGDDKHGQKKEYHEALASQTPEQLRRCFWTFVKHDNPDAILLRFLRARKWDVQAAMVMMISTLHWRDQEMHVDDDIMLRGEGHALTACASSNAAEKKEGEDFMIQLRMGKSFLYGLDKDGRPCCYVRVRLHRQGEQSEKSLERVTVYTIETTRLLLKPNVDTATIVFDMTDFSMANMDYTPVKFMIKCFEANYPESLGSVLVYKSPWIFQGIWKIIRGWLDPVVAGKVHFVSGPDELSQFIPREQIITELGGENAFTYKYPEPAGKEDGKQEDTATRDALAAERVEISNEYEKTTLAWIQGDAQSSAAARQLLAERLAKNYWQADPYIRARSLYDRAGVIQAEGSIDAYALATKPTTVTESKESEKAVAPPAVQTTNDDVD
ncbi:hypothetical protein R9X50_00071000 [Acrodontium crateriforme]|uniref:CRAL-TRIO domain-containing protein n=1 Tax=Acrodontium crateriforme TaxID=150365 RepID=A0AAQ3R9E3_9PEZI|nr:hypothetical protein R9X50_00071000 [Acrodontium crateriforme]